MAEQSDTLVIDKTNSNLQHDTDVCMDEAGDRENGKAMCPTLIAESTKQEIPPNLKKIIESLSGIGGSDKDASDLLACLFYTLMIEVGFIPIQMKDSFNDGSIYFHKARLRACNTIMATEPKSEMNPNLYTFEFILQPFPGRVCHLLCMGMAEGLAVNLIVDETYLGCAQFLYAKYVPQVNCEDVSRKFANLDLLSDSFKTKIAYVAKDVILRDEGVLHAVLQDLPFELLYKILVMLPVKDLLNATMTCRRFRQCLINHERKLWKHLFLRDFPAAKSPNIDESWRTRFKEEFRNKKQKPCGRRDLPDYLM